MTMTALKSPLWRPYTQHALADEPLLIGEGRGATLYTPEGRPIFDAISSWWVNLHGHAHPKIARAIAAQAERLEHVIFAGFTHEPAERLAAGLIRVAPPGLEHVFLSDNGSTAVEVALKLALGSWRNRGEERPLFVALEHAYHGDTFGAMSVSARGLFTASYEKQLFDVRRIPVPAPGRENAAFAALERLLDRESGRIAALILEPLVLGAGGMLMYEPSALKSLAELARARGVLVIADEVMTGFGRTGTMFACEQAELAPDILCLSKGITGGFLPLGATLASGSIYDAFLSSDRAKTFFHGHSYAGNPVACAAAAANLDIFQDEPVEERTARIAHVHRRRLARFAGDRRVRETRQRGTIAAVELRVDDAGYLSELGPKLHGFYLSRGVLLRPLGNVVYMIPPYCSSEEELNNAYDAIEDSLAIVGD